MTFSFAPNDEPLYVSEGDYVQFKFQAPSSWNTTQTVTLQIGDLLQYWLITTIAEDFTPDPYPMQGFINAEVDTLYTFADGSRPGESIVVVSGLTEDTQAAVGVSANVSIPGGSAITDYVAMRIDYEGDGTWDTGWIDNSTATTVKNNARIQVRGRTSIFYTQIMKVVLEIGTATESWNVQNETVPGNFAVPFPNFTDLDPVEPDTMIYSEVLVVQGMNEDGPISVSGTGEYALSVSGNTSTNVNGFEVLLGAAWSTSGTVSNGDYLQLRIPSSNANLTLASTDLSIADTANGSSWTVTTGVADDDTPGSFAFQDKTNQLTNILIGSDQQPSAGISGLTAGLSVPVELVSTDSSLVRVRVNDGSIGVFPTSVQNGDKLTIYLQSSTQYNAVNTLQIKVGDLSVPTWTVITGSGPDSDAIFTPPLDLTNQVPDTYVTSSQVTISGINIPITISATNGSLISIDSDIPIAGPRTFDPNVNTSFALTSIVSTNLNTPQPTTVTVGTGSLNNPFTWIVTSYAVAPPPSTNLGVWYSKKVEKFDGYPIGTVLPILKEGINDYGDLDGDLNSRYPGFIKCEGQSLSIIQYFILFDIIGYTYGGSGSNFNIPDYRNRRLCGTGQVDASRGNSASLPIDTGGSNNNVGAEGGYWYFDKVDVLGPDPLEQIQGTGTSGVDSQFFSLGTVKISGLETVTDDIAFTIVGQVSGIIGPLEDVLVNVPIHSHAYIAAIPDGDGGDPLIKWGPTPGKSLFGSISDTKKQYSVQSEPSGEAIAEAWASFINSFVAFNSELKLYYGNSFDAKTWAQQNLPTNWMVNQQEPFVGTTDFGPEGDDEPTSVDFMTWWISPVSGLAGASLTSTGATENNAAAAVVDTEVTKFTIDSYIPTSGFTNAHSHFITEDPVQNAQFDFSSGNFGGAGQITSGLGNAETQLNVVFTQADIFMDMTDATFKWNSSFSKPTPSVSMTPQIQVPILNPFHKTKYIIKAY